MSRLPPPRPAAADYLVRGKIADEAIETLAVEYLAPGAPAPTRAWLVRPLGRRAEGGLAYFHYYGPGGSYGQFLDEAKEFAHRGTVALLPAGRVPWERPWSGLEDDLEAGLSQVEECRMGLRLLASELASAGAPPQAPLVAVGHDYGAMLGLAAAAGEPRVTGFAALAFAPRYSDWIGYFNRAMALSRAGYDALMAPLDPLAALRRLADRSRFLQFAEGDIYVSPEAAAEIAAAAPGALVDRVYAPGLDHENLWERGAARRLAWLEESLGLR